MYRPFVLVTDASDGCTIAIRCDAVTSVVRIPAIESGPDMRPSHTDVGCRVGKFAAQYSVVEPVEDIVNYIERLERVNS